MMICTQMDSPVGTLTLAASDTGLHLLEFAESAHPVRLNGELREGTHPVLERTKTQLREYFAGTRREFDLPLAPQGTPFQCAAWMALASIAYGQTISYAEQAARGQRAQSDFHRAALPPGDWR